MRPTNNQSVGLSSRKRARQDDDYRDEDTEGNYSKGADEAADMASMAEYGKSTGSMGGAGSAWEGQKESLKTDSFIKTQFTDVRNDIHHALKVSSHLNGQGGNICDAWTVVPGAPDVLKLTMGYFTGNQLMGQANMFNQYYLCRLKGFTITFKDIVVALEASTNVGLTTMADVTTEWRRRPLPGNFAGTGNQAPPTNYPDWWQDWRPAVDGAVSFRFNVNSRRVPAWLASAQLTVPNDYTNVANYRSLRQFLFGTNNISYTLNTIGDIVPNTTSYVYPAELAAYTHEWMDFFFEWRARNCPNATSGTNTSARYNMQIETDWEMSHRLTKINSVYTTVPVNKKES